MHLHELTIDKYNSPQQPLPCLCGVVYKPQLPKCRTIQNDCSQKFVIQGNLTSVEKHEDNK